MISTNDLYKEIGTIESNIKKEKDVYKASMLKIGVLLIKLLQNIRTNTVKVMDHYGVEKIKPKRENVGERNEEA